MSVYKPLGLIILAGILMSPMAEAGSLGKAFARSAMSRVFKRDLLRDTATVARPVVKPRQVWRYTTREQAARDARFGLAPGRHMTAQTTRGRPPSPETAQRRYGLGNQPEVRETWELPAGTPVRSNKAFGGTLGIGEKTSRKRVPPENLVRTIPLKSSTR